MTSIDRGAIAAKIVRWQKQHGRNNLPWQNTRDPYRVWLSEIMLQQTQVVTVLDYFARFLVRFPNVRSLAEAPLDDVLGLWSGLGYYTRARNLHHCAQTVVAEYGGEFPKSAAQLQTLKGIGRSTAAAIASLCFGEAVAILDANVKRVVTRVTGFSGDIAQAAQERELWEVATRLLPLQPTPTTMQRYTQGMMDLGAMVCLPRKPLCQSCPIAAGCTAQQAGNPLDYPVRTRKLKRTSQSLWVLWLQRSDGAVFLSRRPTPGMWAGLYCLPLFDSESALLAAVPQKLHEQGEFLPMLPHVLTHKDLFMHPWTLRVNDLSVANIDGQWIPADQWPALGLPAPVRKLLAH